MWWSFIISRCRFSLSWSLYCWNQQQLICFRSNQKLISRRLRNLRIRWIRPRYRSRLRSLPHHWLLQYWRSHFRLSNQPHGKIFQIFSKSRKRSRYGRPLSCFILIRIRFWLRINWISKSFILIIRIRFSSRQNQRHRFRKLKNLSIHWHRCWIQHHLR